MPPRRRQQTAGMLYTLIISIGFLIAFIAAAVIFYVKAEDYRTRLDTSQREINDLANNTERQRIGAIVGAKQAGKSRLGSMVDYLDRMASLIIGGLPQDTSAEVKVQNADREVGNALNLAREYIVIGNSDPNTIGLIRVIRGLKTELDNIMKAKLATEQQLNDLQERFKNADKANSEKEQVLLAEKDKLQQQVDKIKQDYAQLQALLEQNAEEQVKTLTAQLEQEKTNSKELNDILLKTQAELKTVEDMMRRAQQEVMEIKPPPDSEVLAYKPDGKIISVDDQAKVVNLNIGSNDHVYRGLTFSVYDGGTAIPKDGKGKAEIEVFDVAETFSVALITRSEIRKPILQGDIVANLIWDSDKTNVFVVVGDFDLDNDGYIDYNGVDKIKALIEKWGGRAADTVSIDTDFLVLGKQPQVLRRPTFEEQDLDPSAMEKYQASQERLNHYRDVQSQVQALWIPIFTYERFLYFIGYKGHIGRAGAF